MPLKVLCDPFLAFLAHPSCMLLPRSLTRSFIWIIGFFKNSFGPYTAVLTFLPTFAPIAITPSPQGPDPMQLHSQTQGNLCYSTAKN